MAKGTIIYMGSFELPDKNAAAYRVRNNGKIFNALGYRAVYLGVVRGEQFAGIRQSSYDADMYEEAYPVGTKQWIKHFFDTKNIEAVVARYPDTCMVICYNLPLATYKAIKKVLARRGIKTAFDCTEWNDFSAGALPKRVSKIIDEKQIHFRLHKACEDIMVISRIMEKQYQGANVLHLPPMIDTEDSIWHQTGISEDDTFTFCFAGFITYKEKLDAIISALSQIHVPQVRLWVIGTAKDEYLQEFPAHEALLQQDKRIIFTGKISHEETIRRILSCDCYVFIRESTRRNEAGFPTKFVESYTCGVPILSTNVSDIHEYKDDSVILLESTDEQSVLQAMQKIMQQKREKHALRQSFDYRNYIEPTRKWLEKALSC